MTSLTVRLTTIDRAVQRADKDASPVDARYLIATLSFQAWTLLHSGRFENTAAKEALADLLKRAEETAHKLTPVRES